MSKVWKAGQGRKVHSGSLILERNLPVHTWRRGDGEIPFSRGEGDLLCIFWLNLANVPRSSVASPGPQRALRSRQLCQAESYPEQAEQ